MRLIFNAYHMSLNVKAEEFPRSCKKEPHFKAGTKQTNILEQNL